MFGEKEIVGQQHIKVNSNNQITLPKFTGAEVGDDLIVTELCGDFIIYRTEHYLTIINYLKNKLKRAIDINEKQEIRKTIRGVYYTILRQVKCDKNRNITLPAQIRYEQLECIGERKHLILRPIKKED